MTNARAVPLSWAVIIIKSPSIVEAFCTRSTAIPKKLYSSRTYLSSNSNTRKDNCIAGSHQNQEELKKPRIISSLIPKRRIVGYHIDEENQWVAQLECGHFQHVHHDPPMTERPWVLTLEGRDAMLGYELGCKKCLKDEPPDAQ
mmetsp:Transcript_13937/g.33784  ORF Transcript_13937/g.33784 Transcript_13937/m.33784 type:complete len:144 (+) Transcript_13937:343-774(+)